MIQQLFNDINNTLDTKNTIDTNDTNDTNDIITTTYIRLDDMKEINVKREKSTLIDGLRTILCEEPMDQDLDLMNNGKQRSETRDSDKMLLNLLYTIGVDMNILAQLIKESPTESWNQRIIHSGLTKEIVCQMLSQKYDSKHHRSEDMQRIMSFYPYNIRLTDFSGYFEKREISASEPLEEKENMDPDPKMILSNFQDMFTESSNNDQNGEIISIFVQGNTRSEDMYMKIHILNKLLIVKMLFGKEQHTDNLVKYMQQEGKAIGENLWELEIPIYDSSFIQIIINWFKKQDIGQAMKTISVGNLNINKYYYTIFKLLKNLSAINNDDLISSNGSIYESKPDDSIYKSKPDDWFNKPAEGRYIPTGDSDIEENDGNGIDHYIYHNHCVDNIYRLDAGITNYSREPHIMWNICFNSQIQDVEKYIPESMKSKLNDKKLVSFGEYVHANEVTMGMIDFLATNLPVGKTHVHVIEALDSCWD